MSRDIQLLQPSVRINAQRLLAACAEGGLDILVYCTVRDMHEQARCYRQGRSLAQIKTKAAQLDEKYLRPDLAEILMSVGPQFEKNIVTWSGPGQSLHNYGLALDAVPMRNGKLVWGSAEPEDIELWYRYGEAAETAGFAWAGRWRAKKREYPHIQDPKADWHELIREAA